MGPLVQVGVDIPGVPPGTEQAFMAAIERVWPFDDRDWEPGAGSVVGRSETHLSGPYRDDQQLLLHDLLRAIWRANGGKYLAASVTVYYIEQTPTDSCTPGEEGFARIMAQAGSQPAC